MIEQIPDNQLNADSAANWIQQLDRQLNEKHLLKHPFYQAWSAGKLSLDDLRYYACQYYHHVEAFPGYVRAAIHNCNDPQGHQVLCENLADEEGASEGQDHHTALWLQFTEGLGLSVETVKKSVPTVATKQCIEDFLSCARSSYPEGLAALYAYERQIPQTAASKIMGLKEFYNIADKDTLKFFMVHLEADVKHSGENRTLMQALPLKAREKAKAAAEKAAQSVWNLLSDIQAHTIGMTECMH